MALALARDVAAPAAASRCADSWVSRKRPTTARRCAPSSDLLRELYDAGRREGLALDTLSMGMSADLEAAIAEGATQVRIGSALFGPRGPATRTRVDHSMTQR